MSRGADALRDPRSAEPRALGRRRKEIERRLAGAGLVRDSLVEVPRWLDPTRQARFGALRAELGTLGPVFACFGRYLSSRLDHLAGADCRELARLADRAEPLAEPAVRELLRAEFGLEGAASLAEIESPPVTSSALAETRRGWLTDGRVVLVKLARTSVAADPDLALLPQLAGYLSSLGWPLAAARRVVDDFRDYVQRRLDLRREAESLALLDGLPREGAPVGAPSVIRSLSSARVLTLEMPQGEVLREAGPEDGSVEAIARARTLADLWIRLVFHELRVLEEFSAADVSVFASGGMLWLGGGLFRALSRDEADGLWRYLSAAGRDDPDEIVEALRALTTPTATARPDALRHQMGHVVPRRDGRFGEMPPGFPELLLSHWLQAERHGLVPAPALLAFYRGLVSLREVTGPPLSRGVLRESLQVAQISRGTERLRRALDPALLARGAEGVVQALTDLPRLLQRRGLLQAPRTAKDDEREGRGTRDARAEGWMTPFAWLLLAATAALWIRGLPASLGSFTGLAQALILALFGVALLRWIGRD